MVLPGHLAAGYLVTTGLLALGHPVFSSGEMNALLLIGTLAGEGPDVDLALFYLEHRLSRPGKKQNHHEYLTHAPIVWLVGCALLSLVGLAVGSAFVEYLGLVILAGSWSHLLFDSLDFNGVMWLWPFSKKWYSLHPSDPRPTSRSGSLAAHAEFIKGHYVGTLTFWIELGLIAYMLYLILIAR